MRSSIWSVVVAEPLTVAELVTVAEPVTVLDAREHNFASCSMHSSSLRTHPQLDEDDGHNE